MTLARSFPVIPNIFQTTLAGIHGSRCSRDSFFTLKSWKSGLIVHYRGVHAQD
jgi:hypothetical protein